MRNSPRRRVYLFVSWGLALVAGAGALVVNPLGNVSAPAAGAVLTFVNAASGNDANSCAQASPCKTFAGALSQTSDGGEIIAVTSGNYGVVTITQSVSLIAAPGIYAEISVPSGQNAITINAFSGDVTVTLRGLSLASHPGVTTNGILMASSGTLSIEDSTFTNL